MKSNLLNARLVKNLDVPCLGVLLLVENGVDVRQKMHVNTFNRYRAILRSHGFDIKEMLDSASG
jgi:hypothetical protein